VTIISEERFQSKGAPDGGIGVGRGMVQRTNRIWKDRRGRRGLGETWRRKGICDRVSGAGVRVRVRVRVGQSSSRRRKSPVIRVSAGLATGSLGGR